VNSKEASAGIIERIEAAGYRAAFLPYGAVERIKKIYNGLAKGNVDVQYIMNAVSHFQGNQPPDIKFVPLSFLVAVLPGDNAQIVLNAGGRRAALPVPPPFVSPDERTRFDATMEDAMKGRETAHTRGVSQKLLAVLSGLARFGRNNICYVEGLGSYFNLRAFYTDVPCGGGNETRPMAFLDGCGTCGLCARNCPTGAIGANPVIDASRCLSQYNEVEGEIPSWIPASAHHTIISCLRCQEACPANRPLADMRLHSLELSETETRELLSQDHNAIPPELKNKILGFGLDEDFLKIAGRNARLALGNLTGAPIGME